MVATNRLFPYGCSPGLGGCSSRLTILKTFLLPPVFSKVSVAFLSNCSRLARRSGALPSQAWLERRGLGSCALPTHRELPFVYNWGVRSTPPFLPNQVTLQLHFRCSRALRSSVKTFHISRNDCQRRIPAATWRKLRTIHHLGCTAGMLGIECRRRSSLPCHPLKLVNHQTVLSGFSQCHNRSDMPKEQVDTHFRQGQSSPPNQ